MIKKITILGPTCYKNLATLETNKNVNLIYGLNGSGKSTLSEYLRDSTNPLYSNCSIEPPLDDNAEEIFVYNENYVNEVFYSSDTQRGIFSLSKENADARKRIEKVSGELKEVNLTLQQQINKISTLDNDWNASKTSFYNQFWEIKKKYSGGDRVLEYCLDGLKSSKEALAQYLLQLKPAEEVPDYNIEQIKEEIQRLKDFQGLPPIPELPLLSFDAAQIEEAPILRDVITGNTNSRVAKLIDELHNSDWVKIGMNFESDGVCPFCQRPYTEDIISELKQYFNADYEQAVASIKEMGIAYGNAINKLEPISMEQIAVVKKLSEEYHSSFQSFLDCLNGNLNKLREKYQNPSQVVELISTADKLKEVNDIIQRANKIINDFNSKVVQIAIELGTLKDKFWTLIRIEYGSIISTYNHQYKEVVTKKKNLEQLRDQLQKQADELNLQIGEQQKNIVNIDNAITHINSMLIDMGITDFKIVKSQIGEGLYRIVRDNHNQSVFKTLSEGERTIISVLYFIETCQGLIDKDKALKKRIIVIDDPVSSLSNMYMFNIGRLIRNIFYPELKKDSETGEYNIIPKFEQLFILTHSLYFFYEMTEMLEEKRHASQSLFRVSKSEEGTSIDIMRYEHIQSDYHAYWMAIRNQNTHPALIANCMRNIIEYFFNFIEKRDLNNVFNHPRLKLPKYQAFQRYINRESHSLGQNIYDFKDFNYNIFMEAFKEVFVIEGYKEHYKKMMKI